MAHVMAHNISSEICNFNDGEKSEIVATSNRSFLPEIEILEIYARIIILLQRLNLITNANLFSIH